MRMSMPIYQGGRPRWRRRASKQSKNKLEGAEVNINRTAVIAGRQADRGARVQKWTQKVN
jgi:hypothetical protein